MTSLSLYKILKLSKVSPLNVVIDLLTLLLGPDFPVAFEVRPLLIRTFIPMLLFLCDYPTLFEKPVDCREFKSMLFQLLMCISLFDYIFFCDQNCCYFINKCVKNVNLLRVCSWHCKRRRCVLHSKSYVLWRASLSHSLLTSDSFTSKERYAENVLFDNHEWHIKYQLPGESDLSL